MKQSASSHRKGSAGTGFPWFSAILLVAAAGVWILVVNHRPDAAYALHRSAENAERLRDALGGGTPAARDEAPPRDLQEGPPVAPDPVGSPVPPSDVAGE